MEFLKRSWPLEVLIVKFQAIDIITEFMVSKRVVLSFLMAKSLIMRRKKKMFYQNTLILGMRILLLELMFFQGSVPFLAN